MALSSLMQQRILSIIVMNLLSIHRKIMRLRAAIPHKKRHRECSTLPVSLKRIPKCSRMSLEKVTYLYHQLLILHVTSRAYRRGTIKRASNNNSKLKQSSQQKSIKRTMLPRQSSHPLPRLKLQRRALNKISRLRQRPSQWMLFLRKKCSRRKWDARSKTQSNTYQKCLVLTPAPARSTARKRMLTTISRR